MIDFVKTVFGKKQDEATADTSVVWDEALPAAEPVHVSDDTFAEVVLGADTPALVDFWAPWCGPCRMIAPIVEELARDYDGRVVIAKINTDENQQVAGQLGIMGIPTLILFKDGEEVDRIVGYVPRKAMEERLQAVLES